MKKFEKQRKRISSKKQKGKDFGRLIDNISNFAVPKKRAIFDFDIDESDNVSKEESQYRILLCLLITALILILPTTILSIRFSIKSMNEISALKSFNGSHDEIIQNYGKHSVCAYQIKRLIARAWQM